MVNQHDHKISPLEVCAIQTNPKVIRLILCPLCLEEEADEEDMGAVIWLGEVKVKFNA